MDWLRAYLEYTKNQESPEIFHLWIGMTMISAAIRRQVWIDRGYYKLYPNLYVTLVGPSGRQKKSTAIDIGAKILDAVPDVYVIRGRITPEALLMAMNRAHVEEGVVRNRSDVAIIARELKVMFGGDASQASRMVSTLTELYDSQDKFPYQTITHGNIDLHNLYVVVLAATPREWLKVIPEDATGGFIGRVVFVYSSERKRIPRPRPDTDMQYLTDGLRRIASIKGEITVTTQAWEMFDDWYMTIPDIDDIRLAGFYERIHDHVLKVATILALSHYSTTITDNVLKVAISVVNDVAPAQETALQFVGTTEHSQDASRILEQLKRSGGRMSRSQVINANAWKNSAEEITKVIQTLKEGGRVTEIVEGRTTYYQLRGDMPPALP